jgi:hypothetical protein
MEVKNKTSKRRSNHISYFSTIKQQLTHIHIYNKKPKMSESLAIPTTNHTHTSSENANKRKSNDPASTTSTRTFDSIDASSIPSSESNSASSKRPRTTPICECHCSCSSSDALLYDIKCDVCASKSTCSQQQPSSLCQFRQPAKPTFIIGSSLIPTSPQLVDAVTCSVCSIVPTSTSSPTYCPTGHITCNVCATEWAKITNRQPSCPICRNETLSTQHHTIIHPLLESIIVKCPTPNCPCVLKNDDVAEHVLNNCEYVPTSCIFDFIKCPWI